MTTIPHLIARYQAQLGAITEMRGATPHVLAHLLARQAERGVRGDLLEIGVFRAGTAALLAAFLASDQRMFLVDPFQDEAANRKTIQEFAGVAPKQLVFHRTDSLQVNKWREQMLAPQQPLVRLAHIDGEHSYDAVYSDLGLASRFLAPGGLIVVDDIFDTDHACCTQALFDYLRDQPLLHLVALGARKAYLCESRSLPLYRGFFETLPELLAPAGVSVRVCFNDWGQERNYLSFGECDPAQARYQVIGRRCATLADAEALRRGRSS